MIPVEWDDGFTHEGEQGILFRPLLREQRKQIKDMEDGDLLSFLPALFSPPRYWGPPLETLSPASRQWFTRRILGDFREENDAFKQLDETVTMIVQHPGLVKLSCDDCRKFATDHKTGEVLHQQDGQPIRRMLPPLCDTSVGCPKGHWKDQKGTSTLGLKVWRHYWLMRAVGQTYTCPIVARNWALIDWIVRYGRRAEFNPFHR
mgnify:CR=1 FL=1